MSMGCAARSGDRASPLQCTNFAVDQIRVAWYCTVRILRQSLTPQLPQEERKRTDAFIPLHIRACTHVTCIGALTCLHMYICMFHSLCYVTLWLRLKDICIVLTAATVRNHTCPIRPRVPTRRLTSQLLTQRGSGARFYRKVQLRTYSS